MKANFSATKKAPSPARFNKREGRFELAHNGTILLDEISEISPQVQAKLLRVLQERELERVGGNRTIKVDVRVIATTNRRLEESVERKEFRQDLFFRLNVVPIHVAALARAQGRRRLSGPPIHAPLRPQTRRARARHFRRCMAALEAHRWPGNVRELQNVIERAVILCGDGGMLEPEHLGFSPQPSVCPPRRAPPPLPSCSVRSRARRNRLSLAEVEKRHILAVMERTANRTQAAKVLGISIRTLRNKLNEYGVNSKEDDSAADAESDPPAK